MGRVVIIAALLFVAFTCYIQADDVTRGPSLEQRKRIDPECRGRYGLFAIAENCTTFLVCRRGKATYRNCPDGYLFDADKHYCTNPETVVCGSSNVRSTQEELTSEETCFLPPETGPCEDNLTSYFYDRVTDSCEEFVYGGCEGNGNRFETLEDCEQNCKEDGQDNADLTCPQAFGNFSMTADCSRYFSCSQYVARVKKCPQHTVFDRERKECLSADVAHCDDQISNDVTQFLRN